MGPDTWGLTPQRRRRVGLAALVVFLAVTLVAGLAEGPGGSTAIARWLQPVGLGVNCAGLVLLIGSSHRRRRDGTASAPVPLLAPGERRTAKRRIRGEAPLQGADVPRLRAFADRTARETTRSLAPLVGVCTMLTGNLIDHPDRYSLWSAAAFVVALSAVLLRSQREIGRCRAFLRATAATRDRSPQA